jgi:hypothetical protein
MTLDSNHNMVATVVPTPWSVTTAGAWTYETGSYQVASNVAYVYFYANVYQSSGTTTARFDDGFAIFGTHYLHSDQLSTRLTTDATGAVSNPQSWNRYAYVLNNPLVNIDPLGMDCEYGTWSEGGFLTTGYLPNVTNAQQCSKEGGEWISAGNTAIVNGDTGSPGGDCGLPPGGCTSFCQDGVYLGNQCSGPSAGKGSGGGGGGARWRRGARWRWGSDYR